MLTEEKRNVYLNNRDVILDRGHQYLLAQDWNLNDLAKEMNHLLGPRQSALSPSARWCSFRPKLEMPGSLRPTRCTTHPRWGPEHIDFQETDANFAIGWKGNYRIEGRAFIYSDRDAGRTITILG
jgi:hypothetical protein